jgi:hypothetical protein
LAQASTTSEHSTTTEDPNPTSVEFADVFARLLSHVLTGTQRRLLLVLDNLDRVNAGDALAILATLQTFLGTTEHEVPPWGEQVWFLVPFDRVGITALWKQQREPDRTETHQEPMAPPATNFLERLFQIRFVTPLLLLSDWRKYLVGQLVLAFPELPRESLRQVARVYSWANPSATSGAVPPTPRELKQFVNQLVAVCLQYPWPVALPLDHLAYYTCVRRAHEDVHAALLGENLPTEDAKRRLGEDLVPNLAGLLFNVSPDAGMQLLLGEPIASALTAPDAAALTELAEHPGFWDVIQDAPFSSWSIDQAGDLCRAASCLKRTGLLNDPTNPAVSAIEESLRVAALHAPSGVIPQGSEEGDGAGFMLALLDGSNLSTSSIIDAQRVDEGVDDWSSLEPRIQAIAAMVGALDDSQRQRIFERASIRIPAHGLDFIRASAHLRELDPQGLSWPIISTDEGPQEVAESAHQALTAEPEPAIGVSALPVLLARPEGVDWSRLCDLLQAWLEATEPLEGSRLIDVLEVLNMLAPIEDRLPSLLENGALHRCLFIARDHPEAAGRCAYEVLRQRPSNEPAPPNTVGYAVEGYQFLLQVLNQTGDFPGVASGILDTIRERNDRALIFRILDENSNSRPWVLRSIRELVEKEGGVGGLGTSLVLDRWEVVRESVGEPTFTDVVVEDLVRTSDLLDKFLSTPFAPEKAELARLILDALHSEASP